MTNQPVAVTVYHNPDCGTSRNTLALIRNAGIEPTIVPDGHAATRATPAEGHALRRARP